MTDNETLPMDAKSIASNPTAYGFRWVYRDLNKGRDQKTLLRSHVPHIEMDETAEAVALVYKLFPSVVYAGFNGTSAVIRGQNAARPFIRDNPKATDAEIAERIVSRVFLNVTTRNVGSRTKYIGTDGKEYDTLEAAQSASGGKAVTVTSEKELASQFMADAVDMGVPYNIAREKALAKWPGAFVTDVADDAEDEENDE